MSFERGLLYRGRGWALWLLILFYIVIYFISINRNAFLYIDLKSIYFRTKQSGNPPLIRRGCFPLWNPFLLPFTLSFAWIWLRHTAARSLTRAVLRTEFIKTTTHPRTPISNLPLRAATFSAILSQTERQFGQTNESVYHDKFSHQIEPFFWFRFLWRCKENELGLGVKPQYPQYNFGTNVINQ